MARRKRISIWGEPLKPLSEPLPKVQPRPKPIPNPPASVERNQPKKAVLPDPEPLPPPDKFPDEINRVTPRKAHKTSFMDQTKVRRVSLSISVSQEEARLLRQAAADKGMFFSGWAREVLFRSMKRKAPKRPKR